MKKHVMTIGVLLSAAVFNATAQMKYPDTKRDQVTDDYFGTTVADPYRWLEDETAKETEIWVREENKVTFGYLAQIPFRDDIRNRLTQLWDYEKYSVPFKEGDYYLYYKNSGRQNQSVLYIQKGTEGAPAVLLDPNTFSPDGTTSLSMFSVSHDHKYAAYGISKAGSDWNEFYVIELPTGKKREDKLENIKFSGAAWYKDGFFYSRFDAPDAGKSLTGKNSHGKLYYHKIGTPQSKDEPVYEDPKNPTHMFGAEVTDDEEYLIITVSESTSGNRLYFKKLGKKSGPVVKVTESFEHDYSVIDHVNGKLLVLTNKGAANYRLVAIDPAKPDEARWTEIIPESRDVLQWVHLIDGKLALGYLSDVKSVVKLYDLSGKFMADIALPGLGMVSGFSSRKEDAEGFFSFTSFIDPGTVYRYDAKSNTYQPFIRTKPVFNTDKYETRQVFYTGKDGTRIPLFVTLKKGTELNGRNPCYLYGYGGFNIPVTPSYSPNVALFLEQGGIFAVANIRGGGEYGTAWHKAGTKLQKQNVFDDFIAAAEYLIEQGYTSSDKLAISGRSNGGLLIGACMTQRPGLFKVALPGVGVLDMLRYHKFTIGYAWATDYGTSENEEEFRYLLKYSPVHNVKPAEYPATLVFTADHDDRVVPAHSYKFISELQANQRGPNPVLIRIDVNAGHGAGKPLSKTIDEWTDIWTFVFKNLGMEMQSGKRINKAESAVDR